MITRTYETFSSSRASDNAFRALDDVAKITADLEETRVVGGLMSTLLLEAFPAPSTVTRHTSDVDTAISVDLASKGTLHDRLLEAGYEAQKGNRYANGNRMVDLLVPSDRGQFAPVLHGGRAFDSAPGIRLALAGEPIVHQLRVELTTGETLAIEVRTPTHEHAVIIKSLVTRTRRDGKDLLDIYNLLLSSDTFDADKIGGWSLDAAELKGARRDARLALHALVERSDLRATLTEIGVSTPDFTQLVWERVGLAFVAAPR